MNFLVMSHLRWDFVFQRPQHLLTRCCKTNRVFFWEEPVFDATEAYLEHRTGTTGVHVLLPHLPEGLDEQENHTLQQALLDEFLINLNSKDLVLWYYTPSALSFSRHVPAKAVVYDCMDELSAFRGAPPGLRAAEAELFSRADLVFTGGQTLFQSKRPRHHSVHCFPSSIDRKFFSQARDIHGDVPEQAGIAHPRLGFCGVIDERLDIELLDAVARARPAWQFIMIGPVVKIALADLPQHSNIHYLGAKEYQQLPSYLAGWDVGLLPFALNESTRFISPTKTPEYLAAGLPVVSTPITDVVNPYGSEGLVEIAATPEEFIGAIEKALPTKESRVRRARVDAFLGKNSWDLTWSRMSKLIAEVLESSQQKAVLEVDPAMAHQEFIHGF
jgi:glycosyltransferase involved in cell wall biosynthesis